MKNLPLQTTVRPAQAEGSVLQTALDLKEILILSRFKVQHSQVAVIPGKVHSKTRTLVGEMRQLSIASPTAAASCLLLMLNAVNVVDVMLTVR